jgi:hypothetical protein
MTVRPLFIAAFRQYGLPGAIRTDNGTPFACAALGGLTALAVWWVRLGIRLERIEPGCPQQNGRHERMHRTLKEATASPPKGTLRAQQQAFDEFKTEYNEERPHEALGQQPPVKFYRPSSREYPSRLPRQRGYPAEWEKRMVRKGGQMKWKGLDIRITAALWGQEIGLKPIDDGMWAIYFEGLELGVSPGENVTFASENSIVHSPLFNGFDFFKRSVTASPPATPSPAPVPTHHKPPHLVPAFSAQAPTTTQSSPQSASSTAARANYKAETDPSPTSQNLTSNRSTSLPAPANDSNASSARDTFPHQDNYS